MILQRGWTAVIAAFNAECTIAAAVSSAHLAGASAVIVIDDGSDDRTAELALHEGATVVRQTNAGAAAARGRGLDLVTTEFVLFLDADDELLPGGMMAPASALQSEHAAIAIVCGYLPVNASGLGSAPVLPWREGVSLESLLVRGHSPAPPGGILWRTKAVRESRFLSPKPLLPRWAEDYEQLVRGAILGRYLVHELAVCRYLAYGGKSAAAPIKSLRATEQIRRYYAAAVGVQIHHRSDRELHSLALRRASMGGGALARLGLRATSAMVAPDLYARLVVGRLLRGQGRSGSARWR